MLYESIQYSNCDINYKIYIYLQYKWLDEIERGEYVNLNFLILYRVCQAERDKQRIYSRQF